MDDQNIFSYFNKYRVIYLILFLIQYPVIFYSRVNHIDSIAKILIPIFVVYILINAIITNANKGLARNYILIFAFVAVCAGDFSINLTPYGKYSIIPFCIAHISFLIYYFLECRFRKVDLITLVPILIISAVLYNHYLYLMTSIALKIAFAAYLTILSAMLWRACCHLYNNFNIYKKIFIFIGATLFYITDILVGISGIDSQSDFTFWVWLIYPVSLLSLTIFNWFEEPVR